MLCIERSQDFISWLTRLLRTCWRGSRVVFLSTTLDIASTVASSYLLYNASKGVPLTRWYASCPRS